MEEIKKISSGGELCRIALLLKLLQIKTSHLFFFLMRLIVELEGAVSDCSWSKAKRRLEKIVKVCVITHSPQVASLANNHLKVIKNEFETKSTKT